MSIQELLEKLNEVTMNIDSILTGYEDAVKRAQEARKGIKALIPIKNQILDFAKAGIAEEYYAPLRQEYDVLLVKFQSDLASAKAEVEIWQDTPEVSYARKLREERKAAEASAAKAEKAAKMQAAKEKRAAYKALKKDFYKEVQGEKLEELVKFCNVNRNRLGFGNKEMGDRIAAEKWLRKNKMSNLLIEDAVRRVNDARRAYARAHKGEKKQAVAKPMPQTKMAVAMAAAKE